MESKVKSIPVKLCSQEIVKYDLQTQALIQDIRQCSGPLSSLNEINLQIKGKINHLKSKIQELERLAKEQDKETDKSEILLQVENHKQQLTSTQTALRKANLTCQMAIERRQKEELLGEGDTQLRDRKKATKESLAKTSGNITDQLMTISRMMATQVTHSEHTMSSLVSSSKSVGETHEEFKGMGGHITNSRKLLTKYNRRELTDKLLIFLALAFFFATVLYIVKKRIWT